MSLPSTLGMHAHAPCAALEKKRKHYAFGRQFDEKASIIPGCPGLCCLTGVSIKKAAKGQAAALSRFGGAATAPKAGDALPSSVAPTQPVPQVRHTQPPSAAVTVSL